MTPSSERTADTIEKRTDYRHAIDAILERTLTPENVDNYADVALSDLIDVIQSVIQDYDMDGVHGADTSLELEHKALEHFQLDADTVETTLDHIANLVEEIGSLDAYIANHRSHASTVITPPDSKQVSIEATGGSFEESEIVPRLKTVLLILTHEFNVDISDSEQFRLIPGKVTSGMMRRMPYDTLDIPPLNRIVNICDEKGNITFIFDRDKLMSLMDIDSFNQMSKDEKYELLGRQPLLGSTLKYSAQFSGQIIAHLQEITTKNDGEMPRLLKVSKDSEGLMSVNAISIALFGKSSKRQAINEAVSELGSALGEIQAGYAGRSPLYNETQVAMIKQWLMDHDHMIDDDADELLSSNQLSNVITQELGLDRKVAAETIARAINELGDALGEIRSKGVGKKRAPAYSAEQKDLIKNHLWENLYRYGEMPDDYASARELARKYGVEKYIILTAFEKIFTDEQLRRYMAGNGKLDMAIETSKVSQLEDWLTDEGYLWPNGYRSSKSVADSIGTTKSTVRRIASELLTTGKITENDILTRFNTARGVSFIRYSEFAVRAIIEQLQTSARVQRAIAMRAIPRELKPRVEVPDGWKTSAQISRESGVERGSFVQCADYLEKRGKIERLKDEGYVQGELYYYSPDAEKEILSTLNNTAPDGWMSIYVFAKHLGMGQPRLERTLAENGLAGEEFWWKGEMMKFYPPDTAEMIENILGKKAPEGWATERALRTQLGGSVSSWKIILKMASENGKVVGEEFRSADGKKLHYSPEEQNIIRPIAENIIRRRASSK